MAKGKKSKGKKARKSTTSTHEGSSRANKKAPPGFLDLPLEIRNEIYRNLVVSGRLSKRVPNSAYHDSPTESEPTMTNTYSDEIGKIGCQNVHAETQSLMMRENVWIILRVNKNHFGRDMKEHGFGVVACRGLELMTPAVLQISIIYPSLGDKEYDTFLMTNPGFDQLPRALWGVGMQEMILYLDVHPSIAAIPASENTILEPFYQLRGIGQLILKGAKQSKHVQGMASALENPYADSEDVWQDLDTAMDGLQQYLNAGDLAGGAEFLETMLAFLTDCYRLPGPEFLTENHQIYRKILNTTAQIAVNLANARQVLGDFGSAIKYANYAMEILVGLSQRKRTAIVLRIRGESFAGFGSKSKALDDLLKASDLSPGDKSITDALAKLKNSLDPDPSKALKAFKDLRVSMDRKREAVQRAVQRTRDALPANVIIRTMPNGMVIIEDRD